MTFYETLAIAMSVKGMTPSDICAKTGIHPSYFTKLKQGKMNDVTWNKAIAIIDALGMTPSEFARLQQIK